jgi:hypothetical protein
MPNFDALFNRFKRISDKLKTRLENNLPNLDEAEFFQVFGGKLEANLSAHGKNIYAEGLDQTVLTAIHKETSEKLNQDYKETLASAAKKFLLSFDTSKIANNAQEQFELKFKKSKQALLEKLTNELAAIDQKFTNPADKKELNTAFSNYLNTIGQKYKNNLNEINSIWSELAKWKLHLSNKESEAKAKNADFTLEQTDPKKLPIGIAPNPSTGYRVDVANLAERLMHIVAKQKPGEKIHIELTCPDRDGIIRQIGEIGSRSPAVALVFAAAFYLLAMLCNNDQKKIEEAFLKVIKENGIKINPEDITFTSKQLNNSGNPIVTRKKGPLEPEHIKDLQQANQELIENLKKVSTNSGNESDRGYESGGSSSDEEDEEVRNSRTSLRR